MDETQWLPKGHAIITPERQRMLSIDVEYDGQGIIKYARAQTGKTVLQYLHDQHILDDEEYHNGRDYEFWREMFRAFCSSQRMTASYDSSNKGQRSGDGNREYAYSKLLRMLPGSYQIYINYAIDRPAIANNLFYVKPQHSQFQRVFNRLGASMNIIREEIEECA